MVTPLPPLPPRLPPFVSFLRRLLFLKPRNQNKTFFRPQPSPERLGEGIAGEASARGGALLPRGGLGAQEFDGGVPPSQRVAPAGGCLSRPGVADGSGGGGDADGRTAAAGEGGGLWALLCRELGLTECQEAQVHRLVCKCATTVLLCVCVFLEVDLQLDR